MTLSRDSMSHFNAYFENVGKTLGVLKPDKRSLIECPLQKRKNLAFISRLAILLDQTCLFKQNKLVQKCTFQCLNTSVPYWDVIKKFWAEVYIHVRPKHMYIRTVCRTKALDDEKSAFSPPSFSSESLFSPSTRPNLGTKISSVDFLRFKVNTICLFHSKSVSVLFLLALSSVKKRSFFSKKVELKTHEC